MILPNKVLQQSYPLWSDGHHHRGKGVLYLSGAPNYTREVGPVNGLRTEDRR